MVKDDLSPSKNWYSDDQFKQSTSWRMYSDISLQCRSNKRSANASDMFWKIFNSLDKEILKKWVIMFILFWTIIFVLLFYPGVVRKNCWLYIQIVFLIRVAVPMVPVKTVKSAWSKASCDRVCKWFRILIVDWESWCTNSCGVIDFPTLILSSSSFAKSTLMLPKIYFPNSKFSSYLLYFCKILGIR